MPKLSRAYCLTDFLLSLPKGPVCRFQARCRRRLLHCRLQLLLLRPVKGGGTTGRLENQCIGTSLTEGRCPPGLVEEVLWCECPGTATLPWPPMSTLGPAAPLAACRSSSGLVCLAHPKYLGKPLSAMRITLGSGLSRVSGAAAHTTRNSRRLSRQRLPFPTGILRVSPTNPERCVKYNNQSTAGSRQHQDSREPLLSCNLHTSPCRTLAAQPRHILATYLKGNWLDPALGPSLALRIVP